MPPIPPSTKHRRYDNRQSAWRRGYDADWRRTRNQHLHIEPLCRICKARGYITPANTVDHIIPITERPDLRLDHDNLRSLCATCHNQLSDTQRVKGCDANGIPLDPHSHWNAAITKRGRTAR
jgi:5-methylcytosine-specific restriction enzyme A